MFPLLNKHLYIGQLVDGYEVVTMNSTYTGGLMMSPIINPQLTYDRTYAETLNDLTTYNSGGSVTSTGGSTITTSFTDWRMPTKSDWQTMVGYDRISLLPVGQVVWTDTNGDLDPSNAKYTVEFASGNYIFIEYNKTSDKAVKFVRSFTL